MRLTRRGKVVAWLLYFVVVFALNSQLPSEAELTHLCNDC